MRLTANTAIRTLTVHISSWWGHTSALPDCPAGCASVTAFPAAHALALQLLRFYDVDSGVILLDGIPIKEWNLAHLRERIGVVNQEPTLFGVSVADNIAFGKPLSSGPATREEIEAAARAANVHDFLVSLPDGYDTVVGSSVSALSSHT